MDVSFCEYVSFLEENVCQADTEHACNCLHLEQYPQYLEELLSLRCVDYHDERYGTDILSHPKPVTTTYGLNSFSYTAAAKFWNALPDKLRTLSSFRNSVIQIN